MDYTSTERQKRYRERMHKAGFKKIGIWVSRKEPKYIKMNTKEFVKRLKKLTDKWGTDELSQLFYLFITIIKSKKGGKII